MENNQWLDRWNNRYENPEYAYGTQPNIFLQDQLADLKVGRILFPAEGEGRNAVYAATRGWEVSAFDISEQGRNKGLQLAEQHGVAIHYEVGELPDMDYVADSFDAVALIFAHFPSSIKSDYHRRIAKMLKPGGVLIFEAFSKNHLPIRNEQPAVGGPDNLDDLFSKEEIAQDFADFSFDFIEEMLVELNEGLYHRGTGSVLRFVARKNNG